MDEYETHTHARRQHNTSTLIHTAAVWLLASCFPSETENCATNIHVTHEYSSHAKYNYNKTATTGERPRRSRKNKPASAPTNAIAEEQQQQQPMPMPMPMEEAATESASTATTASIATSPVTTDAPGGAFPDDGNNNSSDSGGRSASPASQEAGASAGARGAQAGMGEEAGEEAAVVRAAYTAPKTKTKSLRGSIVIKTDSPSGGHAPTEEEISHFPKMFLNGLFGDGGWSGGSSGGCETDVCLCVLRGMCTDSLAARHDVVPCIWGVGLLLCVCVRVCFVLLFSADEQYREWSLQVPIILSHAECKEESMMLCDVLLFESFSCVIVCVFSKLHLLRSTRLLKKCSIFHFFFLVLLFLSSISCIHHAS